MDGDTHSLGEPARQTGLTVKTIRFYSDRGIVAPTDRSPATTSTTSTRRAPGPCANPRPALGRRSLDMGLCERSRGLSRAVRDAFRASEPLSRGARQAVPHSVVHAVRAGALHAVFANVCLGDPAERAAGAAHSQQAGDGYERSRIYMPGTAARGDRNETTSGRRTCSPGVIRRDHAHGSPREAQQS